MDGLRADDDRDYLAKRYGLSRAPPRKETVGYWEADFLAEKAKAVGRKALDLLAERGGGAELRDAEIRLNGPLDRALRSVHKKEPTVEEVRYVAARPAQLSKYVKEALAQIISGIGVEVTSGPWWRNADE